MSSSLSNLVDKLSDRLHTDKYTVCKSYLEYTLNKINQLIFRCFDYKRIIRNTLINN